MLKVLIVGGGPAGLILAILLLSYFKGRDIMIKIYEHRIKKDNLTGLFVWKEEEDGNKRREQVVTLQNDTTIDLNFPINDNETLSQFLLQDYEEMVWPTSKNIPICILEDRLLQALQQHKYYQNNFVIINDTQFNAELYLNEKFDIIVGCDGGRSVLKDILNIKTNNISNSEYAVGIYFNIPEMEEGTNQRLNALLTVIQTRYLLNCSYGKRGYLNIRLTQDEFDLFTEGPLELLEELSYPLYEVVLEGLKLFGIPKEHVYNISKIFYRGN